MTNNKICFKYKITPSISVNNTEEYYVIPFGHRCSSALAIKFASLRKMSLPFDWSIPLYPNKIQHVLENDFKDFIPDVQNSIFQNKYGFRLAHFNNDVNEGITQYNRRIARFKKIMKEDKKMFFVYINEDYLYDEKYREKQFNDNLFSQMLELELYLKEKYPKMIYKILYFNFFEHTIPKESNIINIVLNTNMTYNNPVGSPYEQLRSYCGKILSIIFKSTFNPGYNHTRIFYEEFY